MRLFDAFRSLFQVKRTESEPPRSRNYFAGASFNRLTQDFLGGLLSGHQEVKGDLDTLRARSRQICRDNPMGRRFLSLVAANVIGPTGIRLQVKSESARGELASSVNTRIEQAWKRWGKPDQCTVTSQASMPYFQAQVVKTVARDGEAFIRRVRGYPNRFGYALQLLDADLCDTGYDRVLPDGNEVRAGVEIDSYGKEVAYWLWTAHPNDTVRSRERRRFSADDVLHLYLPERMGQTRGVPWLASVIVWLQMLYGYTEAELVAARTASAKMGFIKGGQPLGDEPQTMEADPGKIDRLGVDEDFVSWDPTHPAGNFGPFLTTVLHQVASGADVAHASLTGDLSSVNYSSIRAGMLTERDHWRMLQCWFADHCLDPIYRDWLRMAVLSPQLTVPAADLERYESVAWQPRGWDWVDPQKDVEASAAARAYGFTTLGRILAEQGDDLDEFIAEKVAEDEKLEAAGIELATPKPAGGATAAAADESTTEPKPEPSAEDRGRRLKAMR
jgi:lambda family phage portal protein